MDWTCQDGTDHREEAHYGYQAIQHSLAVSDFLIQAQLLARENRAIELDEFLHDRTLTRLLRNSPAVPDGWLDFRVQGAAEPYRKCLSIEIDRGFHRQVAWRRKIAGLLKWASPNGPYQQQFGTSSLTILIVATRSDWNEDQCGKRRDQLLAWTQAELTAQHASEHTDLFRFTAVNPVSTTPGDLFFSPNWYRPDSTRRALPIFVEVSPAQA